MLESPYRAAKARLYFRNIDKTIPLLIAGPYLPSVACIGPQDVVHTIL